MKLFSNLFTWLAAFFLVWWLKRNSRYDAPEPQDATSFVYKGKVYNYTPLEELTK